MDKNRHIYLAPDGLPSDPALRRRHHVLTLENAYERIRLLERAGRKPGGGDALKMAARFRLGLPDLERLAGKG